MKSFTHDDSLRRLLFPPEIINIGIVHARVDIFDRQRQPDRFERDLDVAVSVPGHDVLLQLSGDAGEASAVDLFGVRVVAMGVV
ncbi:MAG: hypothetical protein ACU83P_07020, partial [Gammaproteobacteria bacterium]